MRAVGGSPLGNLDLDHLGSTARTLITAMTIGIQSFLETPGTTKGISKGMDRGPLILDGLGQFLDDISMEIFDLLVSQRVGRLLRVDPTHPQDLIGVDVTEPGHVSLVEEEGLNLPPALLKLSFKKVQLKRLWGRFWADRLEATNLHFIPGPNQGHPAKLTGIVLAEFRPVCELEDNMSMLIDWPADGLAEVLPFHPQV